MKIKIFLFHRINPKDDDFWSPMPPKQFERTLKYLKRRFKIVSLEEILNKELKNTTNNQPLAAVVFDDGYKDFLDFAYPILKKMDIPSSMYIVTDSVNKGMPPWTYMLDFSFAKTKVLSLNIDTDILPSHLKLTEWKSDKERIAYGKALKPFLKKLSNRDREGIFNQVIKDFNDIEFPEDLMLSWEEIKYLHNNGVTIGSHSVTHPLLGSIKKEEEIEHELKTSFNIIEKEIGKPLSISYPIGSYNEVVKKIAQKVGYKYGLAVNHTIYDSNINDNYEIPRIDVYTENYYKSILRMSGILGKIKSILKK